MLDKPKLKAGIDCRVRNMPTLVCFTPSCICRLFNPRSSGYIIIKQYKYPISHLCCINLYLIGILIIECKYSTNNSSCVSISSTFKNVYANFLLCDFNPFNFLLWYNSSIAEIFLFIILLLSFS